MVHFLFFEKEKIMVTSKECLSKFGNPKSEKFMVIWDVPTELEIGAIPKRIYCNKLMVEPLKQAFTNLIDRKVVNQLKTYDGCFNIRKMRGSNSMSLHSWGIAIDVNATWNRMGKKPTLSKEFVACFVDAGFDWGGNWRYPDGMHFQISKI
jgi:hypothetical protein